MALFTLLNTLLKYLLLLAVPWSTIFLLHLNLQYWLLLCLRRNPDLCWTLTPYTATYNLHS